MTQGAQDQLRQISAKSSSFRTAWMSWALWSFKQSAVYAPFSDKGKSSMSSVLTFFQWRRFVGVRV